eukprot:4792142-Amphidinium_carterae.1
MQHLAYHSLETSNLWVTHKDAQGIAVCKASRTSRLVAEVLKDTTEMQFRSPATGAEEQAAQIPKSYMKHCMHSAVVLQMLQDLS